MTNEAKPLPDAYPLFDVTDAEIAFGIRDTSKYLDRCSGQYALVPREWSERASKLFFLGGSFQDLGIRVRPEHDSRRVHRAVRALLCSWAPAHEVKEGTVGFALMHWCEPIAKADGLPAPQAEERA